MTSLFRRIAERGAGGGSQTRVLPRTEPWFVGRSLPKHEDTGSKPSGITEPEVVAEPSSSERDGRVPDPQRRRPARPAHDAPLPQQVHGRVGEAERSSRAASTPVPREAPSPPSSEGERSAETSVAGAPPAAHRAAAPRTEPETHGPAGAPAPTPPPRGEEATPLAPPPATVAGPAAPPSTGPSRATVVATPRTPSVQRRIGPNSAALPAQSATSRSPHVEAAPLARTVPSRAEGRRAPDLPPRPSAPSDAAPIPTDTLRREDARPPATKLPGPQTEEPISGAVRPAEPPAKHTEAPAGLGHRETEVLRAHPGVHSTDEPVSGERGADTTPASQNLPRDLVRAAAQGPDVVARPVRVAAEAEVAKPHPTGQTEPFPRRMPRPEEAPRPSLAAAAVSDETTGPAEVAVEIRIGSIEVSPTLGPPAAAEPSPAPRLTGFADQLARRSYVSTDRGRY